MNCVPPRPAAAVAFLALAACGPQQEVRVDAQLAEEIAKIKAIDNHAHPVRPVKEGEKPDDEYDALPVENLEAQSDPLRTRPNSPELAEAHKRLFNGDKAGAAKTHGQEYAAKVLDQVGIDVMLANRVAMGPGMPASRFLWVPFADALMYPLANDEMIKHSDHKAFFPLEEKLLNRYYAEAGVPGKPSTLDEYLTQVVRATLERHKQGGAVAEKFEMAYLRTLAIGNPSRAEAEAAYSGRGDYKALQDYLFRFIAAECGRLGMSVHFHAAAGGGGYFDVSGGRAMLLEPLLNDPALRKTNFVLIHGGWPYTREVTALLTKPNCYLDFSEQSLLNSARDLAGAIRGWLEYVPEKVLYATDAYPFSKEMGWEEAAYLANATGREALGMALTAMLRDGQISRERALELARMVLRENARRLYGLK